MNLLLGKHIYKNNMPDLRLFSLTVLQFAIMLEAQEILCILKLTPLYVSQIFILLGYRLYMIETQKKQFK